MSEINTEAVLAQMRAMASRAQGLDLPRGTEPARPEFSNLLSQALNQVNQTQKAAGAMADRFERGDPDVNVAEVMVALQKADISFQAITQVRNRLVSAYQDIMNMPV
ncbi:MAG: flagellar hook-basal body complex protein FliE [Gammaproteobacteria bacterium]|nr:flagellar hook-basal body complex protein FliE [Gammaproteobacteria bacterium]NNM01572.1 flagellar hook-basal body complex protein FliE [Gammaproteobacteria bacterium]